MRTILFQLYALYNLFLLLLIIILFQLYNKAHTTMKWQDVLFFTNETQQLLKNKNDPKRKGY